jgi:RNA polymerase sigma-70 factor (ECF subfamily)
VLGPTEDIPDDRLRLIFTCCHPALAPEASAALALRTMCGLGTDAIARLFLTSEATVAQRLVRAKHKIRSAAIPFRIPPDDRLDERVEGVLRVIYLLFTQGYAPSAGDAVVLPEACDEAIRLGRVLTQLLPTHAEAGGLLALMVLHHARRAARANADGDLVPLEEQDRSLWDQRGVDEGKRRLEEALRRGPPGPYQIQACIAALHAEAPDNERTDWPQIAALYEELWRVQPTPAVAVGLCVAMGSALGAEAGLSRLEAFVADGSLRGFDRLAAARADLLRRAGRSAEARGAYREAVARARTVRETRFLERRAAACGQDP